MIPDRFRRRPNDRDRIFAEAQALLEDGLDVDFVLGLYPDDADWLEPELRTADSLTNVLRAEEPSFFFEASLKNRFVAAGEELAQGQLAEPAADSRVPGALGTVRGALAGMTVVAGGVAVGVLTLGFVTADDAVPGDWNYAFKIAGERVEYALASEPERTNVELRHKEERIAEMQELLSRGDVTPDRIERMKGYLDEVAVLEEEGDLDPEGSERIRSIAQSSSEVLNSLRDEHPDLADEVDEAMVSAQTVGGGSDGSGGGDGDDGSGGGVSAAGGSEDDRDPTTTPVRETPTPAPTEPRPTDTPTPAPDPTATPEPTDTPAPTATPEPEPTSTPTPVPTRTPTPEPTRTPQRTATPNGGDDEEATPEPTADPPPDE